LSSKEVNLEMRRNSIIYSRFLKQLVRVSILRYFKL